MKLYIREQGARGEVWGDGCGRSGLLENGAALVLAGFEFALAEGKNMRCHHLAIDLNNVIRGLWYLPAVPG